MNKSKENEVIRVLLLEDDEVDAERVKRFLAKAGKGEFHLLWATNLSEALQRMSEDSFDVALVDLNLPDAFGDKILESLVQKDPQLPLVILTGRTQSEQAVLATIHKGVQDNLNKETINEDWLVNALRHAIERNKLKMLIDESLENHFKTLTEDNVDGIIVVDKSGIGLFSNSSAESILGCSKKDFIGHLFGFPLITGHSTQIDVRRNGQLSIVELRAVETIWKNNPAILVTLRDITKLKQIEQLRISEEQYRALFESMDEGYCIIEMIFDEYKKPVDYRFLEVNPSFEKQSGLKDVSGKSIRKLIPHIENSWIEIFGNVALTGQPARFENKAEELSRWFDVSAFRFGDVKNNQVAMLVTDITSRKKYQEVLIAKTNELDLQRKAALNIMQDATLARDQLKDLTENLQNKVAEKTKELMETQDKLVRQEKLVAMGHLSSIVGHEFRGPIGAINNSINFIKLKLGQNVDDKINKHFKIIAEEIHRSNKMIEDTLDFVRSKDPTLSVIDVASIIDDAISREQIPVNINISMKRDELLFMVQVDPPRMQRVFSNIILNAIQAMPSGGTLTISARETTAQDKWVEICFEDTGEGLTKENLEKCFEPLFTTKIKGTGLGLAVCQTIIESHRGTITMESQVGVGTKVIIRLPAPNIV